MPEAREPLLVSAFDLVICILSKRLGSRLGVEHQRPDGGQWRSGTEFELVTAPWP